MLLLKLLAGKPWVKAAVLIAFAQFKAVITPKGKFTDLDKLQVCPPIFKVKLAVPLALGVPFMVYVKAPDPTEKVPDSSVAVKPVTPVEVTV